MANDLSKLVSVRLVQDDGKSLGNSVDMAESDAFPLIQTFQAFFTNSVTEDIRDFVEWAEGGIGAQENNAE